MSEPIRSASASPFAVARPQVQSRRVSLRIGSFGLTYSTDRVVWNPPPLMDGPPVDPAPAVESERPPSQSAPQSAAQQAAPQSAPNSFPLDLEAARQQALWQAAQQQAARQQAQAEGQKARETTLPERASRSPAQSEPCLGRRQGTQAEGQGNQAAGQGNRIGSASGGRSLHQAMRQATKAYVSCARNFACPRPMLQAVA